MLNRVNQPQIQIEAQQLTLLQAQEDEGNRALWNNLIQTQEFLDNLRHQKKLILERLETLSIGSSTPDTKLRILSIELKVLTKVIEYARTGKYND